MFKSLKLYSGGIIDLESALATLVEFGYKRQAACREEGDFARRGALLDIFPVTFELPIRLELGLENKVSTLKTFNPASGELLWEHQMLIILPFRKTHSARQPFKEEFPLDNFVDLKIGDYVVHNQHGIGKFLGLEKIKTKSACQDHLVIEYDRQEKLYVPVDRMHLVQRYISFQAKKPSLCRLGSREWLRTKERAKKGIQKFAWELIASEALRMSTAGFSFSADTPWQEEFEKTFPYSETPDQIKTLQQVKADMESAKPMDRLLCGDVGYGKTEVAMRASFKAVMDSKQVAYLVPTTILAQQHYHNFLRRLGEFPVNVQMLSRFKSPGEQEKIIQGLGQGTVDIVIGTHRLLSQDMIFKALGLVIIDEEQRFGVRDKEKLKKIRLAADVLTLTATPIPRTLYMSLMGTRDLSVINTPVGNRLPIKTIVVEYDEDLIRQAIVKEVNRRGQVYFLHNRVGDIEKIKERLCRILPAGIRIACGHGQMSPRHLEKVMLDFLEARVDVLVATMIIESGIDIPNANTLLVNNAHTFGLSDLHQLRGRVGRFNRPAYAYFLTPRSASLDTSARRRLSALQEYAHLGAGFKIAMEDLQMRGAGNLLGAQQHGFVWAIGFDLYCRLLREAVGSLNSRQYTQLHNLQ